MELNPEPAPVSDSGAPTRRGWPRLVTFALCLGVLLPVALFVLDGLWQNAAINRELDLPGDVEKAIMVSEFMAHGFGVAIILLTIWWVVPAQRTRLWRVVGCVLLAGLLANCGKLLVARARPYEILQHRDAEKSNLAAAQVTAGQIHGSWLSPLPWLTMAENFDHPTQSFPSGHTATAFALAFGLGWLARRGQLWFLGLACLAATQRLACLAHWPSDLVAGWAIAWLCQWIILPRQSGANGNPNSDQVDGVQTSGLATSRSKSGLR